jgi:hypothetical protein
LFYEGADSLELASEEMENGSELLQEDRYPEARGHFRRAKAQVLLAKDKYNEACVILDESPILEDCDEESRELVGEIDNCLVPTIELLISYTNLIEDINEECTAFGCPPRLRSDCRDIMAETSTLDARCDLDLESGPREICSSIP